MTARTISIWTSGYALVTAGGHVGGSQESEVRGADWYPLAQAEHLIGHRVRRAVSAPGQINEAVMVGPNEAVIAKGWTGPRVQVKAWLIGSLICSLRRGVLSRGHFCPEDHQQHLEPARFTRG